MKSEADICPWAGNDPLYRQYHDTEWGVPLHDDRKLFELLVLEGMQAGLSWLTILRKRENFRAAFDDFDPVIVANYKAEKTGFLMLDAGIIRNRLKIEAAISNARVFMAVQAEWGSFDAYLWSWVDGTPIINNWQTPVEIPCRTALSDEISKDLIQRGFKFAGSTICYAYMQSAGLVWDHLTFCACCPSKEQERACWPSSP
jgi:DNA-3-methyladenine glycosylase I